MKTILFNVLLGIIMLLQLASCVLQRSQQLSKHSYNTNALLPISRIKAGFTQIKEDGVIKKEISLVDEDGRVRIFRGVNVVVKIKPYLPVTSHFLPQFSLSKKDILDLKSWGFNVVRLGVLWEAVEYQNVSAIGSATKYNTTYLNIVKTEIITKLKEHGIYTIIDGHQDAMSTFFCGEGFPDFVVTSLQRHLESGNNNNNSSINNIPSFPLPAGSSPYKLNEHGKPSLEECLSQPFWNYNFANISNKVIQAFYDNVNGMADKWALQWRFIASKLKGNKGVLAYELFNEPWQGDIYANPLLETFPNIGDLVNLQPLYEKAWRKIKEVDKDTLIMYEPGGSDYYSPVGFSSPLMNDLTTTALAYHVYCGSVNFTGIPSTNVSDCINNWDKEFNLTMEDISKLKTVGFLTEYGAMSNMTEAIEMLDHIGDMVDSANVHGSATYWQFKWFGDYTTQTPYESLYNFKSNELEINKLKAISRTYPIAIAGYPTHYSFNAKTKEFKLSYQANVACKKPTIIYFNNLLHYPSSIRVAITPADVAHFVVDQNKLVITASPLLTDFTVINVVLNKQ